MVLLVTTDGAIVIGHYRGRVYGPFFLDVTPDGQLPRGFPIRGSGLPEEWGDSSSWIGGQIHRVSDAINPPQSLLDSLQSGRDE